MAKVSSLKLRPKPELVIVLDTLDFSWHQDEIEQVIELWQGGAGIADIAKQVRPAIKPLRTERDAIDEVALLIMHLSRQGSIKPRSGGIFGGDGMAVG